MLKMSKCLMLLIYIITKPGKEELLINVEGNKYAAQHIYNIPYTKVRQHPLWKWVLLSYLPY